MASFIEQLLSRRIGLDVESVGSATIDRAVRRRMQACAVAELDRYTALLDQSPPEIAALIDEVVVPETWFFRDGEPFAALAEHLARLAPVLHARPLRILSIPCATGEEAYSIAIVVHEAGLSAEAVGIEAVDISSRVLHAAAQGVFGDYSFRGNTPEFRDRYFLAQAGGWRLRPEIRRRVSFHRGNLLEPETLPGGRYDIVFCRNLLIYFSKESRRRAVGVLSALLNPGGLLFVGHAETAMFGGGELAPVPRRNTFAFTRSQPDAPPPVHRPQPVVAVAPRRAAAAPPPRPRRSMPAMATRSDARPGPLEEAQALANEGRLPEAIAVCRRFLDVQTDSAEAYFLLGLLYESSGDDAVAADLFHKAAYLDPTHAQALLHLSLLAEQAGQAAAAATFRRRARRAAERGGGGDGA